MSKKKSLIVFASGTGTHLQNLIDAQKNSQFIIKALVCNQPKAQAIARAKKAKIDCIVVNHQDFNRREDFEKAILTQLLHYSFDLIALAGFMRFLSGSFIDQIDCPIFNIHPSLLPKYKGLNTHHQVLKSQDRFHGASVHLVNDQLDGGFVIKQIKIPIRPDDDAISLSDRLISIEHLLYLEVITWFCSNRLRFEKIDADNQSNQSNLRVFLDGEKINQPIIAIID